MVSPNKTYCIDIDDDLIAFLDAAHRTILSQRKMIRMRKARGKRRKEIKVHPSLNLCQRTKSGPIGRVRQGRHFCTRPICCLRVRANLHEHTWSLRALLLLQRDRKVFIRMMTSVKGNPTSTCRRLPLRRLLLLDFSDFLHHRTIRTSFASSRT